MNTAYWLAILWGLFAIIALKTTHGANVLIVCLIAAASIVMSLLGVAIQYGLL